MFPHGVNHAIAGLMFLGYDASWADVPARRFMFPERKNNERLYDNLYEGTI